MKYSNYDVVVIGAGPAGLKAAEILAGHGKRVIVFEQKPAIDEKVCAGGITTKSLSFGTPEELFDRSFNQAKICTPLCDATIKQKQSFVGTISRKKLGQFQLALCQKVGAEIVFASRIETIGNNFITTKNNQIINYRYLIGADGSTSLVRRYLKLSTDKLAIAFHYKTPKLFPRLELVFDARYFGAGYAWIFPHKNFTSIGAGFHKEDGKKNYQEIFKSWAKTRNIELNDDWYEAWLINYDYRGYEFDNIYLAGDAAGFASGLTGEGIYFGMVSGAEIAKKIIDKSYDTPKLKEILVIKKEHEKKLDLLKKNKVLSQILYSLGGLAFKTHLFDKKLINTFS